MFLTKKYPDCFVEYRPVFENSIAIGIECSGRGVLSQIEKNVDIQRAKKAGCRGIVETCKYLNGER